MATAFHGHTRLAPLAPSPLAGEGSKVLRRIQVGEGSLPPHEPTPHPFVGADKPRSPLPQGERAQQLRPRSRLQSSNIFCPAQDSRFWPVHA